MRFGNYFQFPFICRQAHSSISFRLEMASDRARLSEFDARKKWNLVLNLSSSSFPVLSRWRPSGMSTTRHHGTTLLQGWPGNSPDLNPIENAWSELKNRQRIEKATSKQALKKLAIKVWRTITPEYLERLYQSMPRRMAAVIAAHGGHTKYWESFWTCICTISVNKLTYLWQATKVFS